MILVFLCLSGLLGLIIKSPGTLQKYRTQMISFFSRVGLKILKVEVLVKGQFEGGLMVGNHMSYLDILVLSSIYPTSYVTSQEIREMPFLGRLVEWAGCLFVERRSRENLSKEVFEIKQALDSELNVTIFPEATSTNAEQILRFRSPLYQAAFDSRTFVQAFCLNYLSINHQPLNKQNRDLVCWYGDMDFLPHLWNLCWQNKVVARVDFLPSLCSTQFEDNKAMAAHTQVLVTEKFRPAL